MEFILPTINTFFIILSAIFMAIGLKHIRARQIELHEKWMKLAALAALIFFIGYVSKTVFIGSTQFGGPDNLVPFYVTFLISHIILSTTGGVLGAYQLFTGTKRKLGIHRKVGPVAATIWFLTAITGIMVYALLYIIYPGGSTAGLFDAIFH